MTSSKVVEILQPSVEIRSGQASLGHPCNRDRARPTVRSVFLGRKTKSVVMVTISKLSTNITKPLELQFVERSCVPSDGNFSLFWRRWWLAISNQVIFVHVVIRLVFLADVNLEQFRVDDRQVGRVWCAPELYKTLQLQMESCAWGACRNNKHCPRTVSIGYEMEREIGLHASSYVLLTSAHLSDHQASQHQGSRQALAKLE